MNTLNERFSAEQKAFEQLRKQTESKVVRWVYWENPDWFWDPEHMVKYWSWGPPERAKKDKARYAYGYDDKKRVVVIHPFRIGDSVKPDSMAFLRYSGDKIVGSKFLAHVVRSEDGVVMGSDWNGT